MVAFAAEYRPQHGVLDELVCAWGPTEGCFEFSITRRLQREGQAEAPLRLSFLLSNADSAAGTAVVTTLAEVRATAGFQATRHARVRARALD